VSGSGPFGVVALESGVGTVTTVTQKSTSEPHDPDLSLWGKWGDEGEGRYPLLAHLLDSAAVAEALFDRWLPPTLARRLDEASCSSGSTARQLVVVGAGLHDLGKANPVFQGQLLGGRANLFKKHVEHLRQSGYWIPEGALLHPQRGREREFIARHEVLSGVLVGGGLGANPTSFGCLIAGHHGKWRTFGELEFGPAASEAAFWKNVAKQNGSRVKESVYVNALTAVQLRCGAGHLCSQTPANVQQGRDICAQCVVTYDRVYLLAHRNMQAIKIGIASSEARVRGHLAHDYLLVEQWCDLGHDQARAVERTVLFTWRQAGWEPMGDVPSDGRTETAAFVHLEATRTQLRSLLGEPTE